jgi:hypothetical protein
MTNDNPKLPTLNQPKDPPKEQKQEPVVEVQVSRRPNQCAFCWHKGEKGKDYYVDSELTLFRCQFCGHNWKVLHG